jgi:hypothetical protein
MFRKSALAVAAVSILSATSAFAASPSQNNVVLGNQVDQCRAYENPTGMSQNHTRLAVDACVLRLREGRSVGLDASRYTVYPQQQLTTAGE